MRKHSLVSRIISVLLVFVFIAGVMPTYAVGEQAVTTITDLTVSYMTNPLGIDENDVRFSWSMDSNIIGQTQTSYTITVREGSVDGEIVWQSGEQPYDLSVGIPYTGDPLSLETRYYWTVTVTDIFGDEIQSEPAYFETGADLTGVEWIVPEAQANSAPLMRTEAVVESDVESAKLYISALGIYTAYINGEKVNGFDADGEEIDNIFGPGWTDYNYSINYQTYDVTDYIADDHVVLGVQLGKGWYAGNVGSQGGYNSIIGSSSTRELALMTKLVVKYADGSEEIIGTQAGEWRSLDGPILENDYFHGETYDANLAQSLAGWNTADFDASAWAGATAESYPYLIRPGNGAMTRIAHEYTLEPVEVYTYNDSETLPGDAEKYFGSVVKYAQSMSNGVSLEAGDVLIADLGQNMVGVVALTVSGPKGATVTMRHAEMLNDGKQNPNISSGGSDNAEGTLYMKAITNANVTDKYILSDEAVQNYQPSLTYHGFRYVEITADQDVTIHGLEGKVITSVGDQLGEITTNNAEINQLVSNSRWSQMGNYMTIPTDCPQRGERAGWTGDAQLFAQTAVYHYDVYAFLDNYAQILDEHAANSGDLYGAIVPTAFVGFFASTLASGWSDAGIIIPWVIYQQTGDVSIVAKHYDQMDKYMDAVGAVGYNTGVFGDWLAFTGTNLEVMNAVYRLYTAQLMEKMAVVIGDPGMQAKYEQLFAERKADYLATYFDADGNLKSGGGSGLKDNAQTGLLWSLKLGLYADETHRDYLIEQLILDIRNEGSSIRPDELENTLSVGFLGVNVILPVLTEIGAEEVAYDLLLQDAMPSWLGQVKAGATTTWERWDSYSLENSFGDSGMNSFNHYSYGACVEWMFSHMAGIKADESNPGFKHIILQPSIDFSERLTDVEGAYDSIYGAIESNWATIDGNLTAYSAVVPANTTATLYLPVDESAVGNFADIPGVKYEGMEEHNGGLCAKFALLAGGYSFTVENGALTVELQDGYVDPDAVDKSELQVLYAQYRDLEESDYTAETWALFQQALAEAKAVLEDDEATQQDVDAACEKLRTAVSGLEAGAPMDTEPDKEDLQNLYDEYNEEYRSLNPGDYTADSWAAFEKALEDARAVLDDENATQAEIDAALTALGQAYNGLTGIGQAAAYTITASANTGGTVTGEVQVAEGRDAVVEVKADEGHKLVAILVDGVTVDLSDVAGGVYTIENVQKDMELRALFVADQEDSFAAKYTDVPEGQWYYEAVDMLTGLGIVEGVTGDSYAPDKEITRAEFTKLMYELAGILGVAVEEVDAVSFGDVAGHWAYGFIGWARETSLVKGYDEETFGPEDDMLRQDMAVFMLRFFDEHQGYDLPGGRTKTFDDGDEIEEYAEEAVEYVVRTGLMEGHANGAFGPVETARRSHVAQVMYNYLIYTD